jgi:pimeloyl-ACP methyl ester carboxylesterase
MSHEVSTPTIRGTRIRMFRGGSGDPVVFLHGGAGLAVWTPFFQALAAKHDLLVPEHPGFGQSDNPAWVESVADLALFYLDYLAEFAPNPVHLIGNSFGGWIATELAVRDARHLRSLTLIGPSGLPHPDPAHNPLLWSWQDSVRNLFHNPAIPERMLSQAPGPEQVATLLKNQTTVARLSGRPALANPELAKWLHRVTVPAHVVWGRHDRLAPASMAKTWTSALPNATATVIEDAGHLPHAEQTEATATAVLGFLSTV